MALTEDLIQRQLALEEDMRTYGISRYRKLKDKAEKNRDETATPPGYRLLQGYVGDMTKAVEAFFAEAGSGRPGRRHTAVKHLSALEPLAVALITTKTVLDGISRDARVQSVAVLLGRFFEDELWFRAFSGQKPALWSSITQSMLAEQIGTHLQQSRLRRATVKYDVKVEHWTRETCFHVGMKCIDLFIASTGLVKTETVRGKRVKDTVTLLSATDKTREWLREEHSRNEIACPIYLPMLCPPSDWTTPFNGGYLTNVLRRRPLVKSGNKNYLEELSNHDMPAVYDAVNAMQRTPWKINAPVMVVVKSLWDSQATIGKLPSIKEDVLPEFPADKDDKAAVDKWRRTTRAIHEGNGRRRSKRIALAKALWVAELMKEEPAFYFPYSLCFRGRAYPRPLFLTPQGSDPARAMLTFAEGVALGEQGACWLAVHGANTWGFDKVDLQARIDWVEENKDNILKCAAEPLDHLWWADADKPFQFLAFCFEWAGFMREGFAFKSSLPIAMDGSCNGLQNFSMALRDEVGGAAVNLVPADKPADIYQRVADKVIEKLNETLYHAGICHCGGDLKDCLPMSCGAVGSSPVPEAEEAMAKMWLRSGLVTRKLCKRPVMTLPYGAKQYGMRAGIVEFLREQMEEGVTVPFGDDLYPAARFIAAIIWTSIEEVVIAARGVMDFLQHTAQLAGREGLPVHWVTPVGFPVFQEYKVRLGKSVQTYFNGNPHAKFILTEEGTKLDRRRQSSGISPNWVHSLDGSHMMLTVNTCAANGIIAFAMVHDSFGTHASNTELLNVCLRAAFVEQYREDVIETFRSEIADQLSPENLEELLPTPAKGTLDPESVLHSEYFFA